MSVKFTSAQLEAIEHVDENILVSAGAGSGKTAVLSERVVTHIKNGIRLDALVILTFTNAAAKEMKTRIRKRLMQEEKTPNIESALEMLDASAIQTFDSFALSIVRQFGYLRNLSSRVSIGDQAELTIVKRAIIETLFMEGYQTKDQAFLAFVKRYEIKDDQALKTMIYDFYEALTMHEDFLDLIKNYKSTDLKTTFESVFKRYQGIAFSIVEAIEKTLDKAEFHVDHDISKDYFIKVKDLFEPVFRARDYDALYKAFCEIDKLPGLNAVSRTLKKVEMDEELLLVNAYKDEIKKLFDELKKKYLSQDKPSHKNDFYASRTDYPVIIKMIESLHERYESWTFKHEKMDFASIARLALILVKEEQKVQESLRSTIYEIMIDEYQDTNRLQESFIEILQAQNVYTVGDIKQSIYRFRHAEPSLFMERFHRYQEGLGKVVPLNANFRSRKTMLDDINTIFKGIMDEAIGGVDYTLDQQLRYGNTTYDHYTDKRYKEGLTIALYDTEEEQIAELLESKRLDKSAMETFYIAKTIQSQVGKREVYDRDLGRMRPSKYSDFAILISVSKRFDEIRTIFDYFSIPLEIHKDEPFIDYYDIDLYRNILRLLYSLQNQEYYTKHFKHAFLSIARSYAFDYEDDAIVHQVIALPKSLDRLKERITETFEPFFLTMFDLAQRSKIEPLDTVFIAMIEIFKLSEALVKVPDTLQAKSRLDYLTTKLIRFTDEYKTLSDVVLYFDRLTFDDLDVHFESNQSIHDDQVQLMTIHKSKGLEFPFVFIPHLMRNFNRSDSKSYAFDRELGFILQHDNEGLSNSFLHEIYKHTQRMEDISERIRVFYVALTRAKDACYLPLLNETKHTFRFNDNGLVIDYDRIYQYNNYHDIIHSMLDYLKPCHVQVNLADYDLTDEYKYRRDYQAIQESQNPKKEYQEPNFVLSEKGSSKFSASVDTILTIEQFNAIQKGNQLHETFELLRFNEPLKPQLEAMNLDQKTKILLTAFVESPLIQKLNVIESYPEFPFMINEEDNEYTGFIDLLLECDDRWVIIDYKLKNIDKAEYIDQIKGYETILKSLSDKPVEGYLYSIIEQRFKQIV